MKNSLGAQEFHDEMKKMCLIEIMKAESQIDEFDKRIQKEGTNPFLELQRNRSIVIRDNNKDTYERLEFVYSLPFIEILKRLVRGYIIEGENLQLILVEEYMDIVSVEIGDLMTGRCSEFEFVQHGTNLYVLQVPLKDFVEVVPSFRKIIKKWTKK